MGATSEIGTQEKIQIDFKGKCQNNSLERIQTWKMRNNCFVNHKMFNLMNMRMEVAKRSYANYYNYWLSIMIVLIPYPYHLIGIDTFRYLQVSIHIHTYEYRCLQVSIHIHTISTPLTSLSASIGNREWGKMRVILSLHS